MSAQTMPSEEKLEHARATLRQELQREQQLERKLAEMVAEREKRKEELKQWMPKEVLDALCPSEPAESRMEQLLRARPDDDIETVQLKTALWNAEIERQQRKQKLFHSLNREQQVQFTIKHIRERMLENRRRAQEAEAELPLEPAVDQSSLRRRVPISEDGPLASLHRRAPTRETPKKPRHSD